MRLDTVLDAIRTGYWFVPTLMATLGVGLALVATALDEMGLGWIGTFGFTYTRGPDGARTILSTIAGSMVTVATTAFSITIVALQLASTQFGPRLLRNFMRDLGNQIVLGTFIATFLYCLLVLRTVQGVEEGAQFVPQLSVTLAVLLAVASLGVLIYFIHHTAASIQADHVIAAVGRELHREVDQLFPETFGRDFGPAEAHEREQLVAQFEKHGWPVIAKKSGYVEALDEQAIMQVLVQDDLSACLRCRPGSFVEENGVLALVLPGTTAQPDLARKLCWAFSLSKQRTGRQDIQFSIEQLVEIAVRALSPGINDPFTALRCLDQLGSALGRLAGRQFPAALRYDEEGKLRLIAQPTSFEMLVDATFTPIRLYGRSHLLVLTRLLETLSAVAQHTDDQGRRHFLERQAQLAVQDGQQHLPDEASRARLRAVHQKQMADLRF